MADSRADEELAERYRGYLQLCNDGDFDRLGELVSPDVEVNGKPSGLVAYAASIRALRVAFPDFRWRIEHLVVNRPMLAAHLIDTGTHTGGPWLGIAPSGAVVRLPEMAVYAWSGGRISQVWSTSDRLDLRRQLEPGGDTAG